MLNAGERMSLRSTSWTDDQRTPFSQVGVDVLDKFYGSLRNFPYEKSIEEKFRKLPHILSNLSNSFSCTPCTQADIVAIGTALALAKASVAQLRCEAPL
ncbi:hypothetical protein LOKVESSMR4R_02377 [Yoonia vestfoldensis]|uniref:Uncharacterized protein n=1 Tax=Yoonia vestfoldensis TaxID=245188 RepID=A0A1Y0EE94_9RHOB|nr:hypothetical protein LOKVESSMR4R_02377 [Yoonia vestfoldensis]